MVKISRELRGWHARRIAWVGRFLEGFCVGRMPKGLSGCPKNYTTTEDFGPKVRTKKYERVDRTVSWCYTTLSAGLVPDGPVLRG